MTKKEKITMIVKQLTESIAKIYEDETVCKDGECDKEPAKQETEIKEAAGAKPFKCVVSKASDVSMDQEFEKTFTTLEDLRKFDEETGSNGLIIRFAGGVGAVAGDVGADAEITIYDDYVE